MNKDGSSPTNPMLYDPIPEGAIQTTKKMQFLAASAGKYRSNSISIIKQHRPHSNPQLQANLFPLLWLQD